MTLNHQKQGGGYYHYEWVMLPRSYGNDSMNTEFLRETDEHPTSTHAETTTTTTNQG